MRAWLALAACLALAGCGPLSDTHHRPGTSHQVVTGTPTGAADASATVTVSGGKVSPPPGWLSVAKGQQVSLTVTSDVADELHVHGYDVTAELPAGQAVTVTFVADLTGVFEVETHGSKLVLVQVAVK
ncbi:hypothetical protein [Nonomuraea soli]|uniref:EfeO-type cupredoxin-like domain-containing protein n=1 Tax=Nonomuraea soli TaxID=1032476 RepID=A0A7W0CE80_9ACTN|nr:hypothetical protein [Nonomuraea soli]MBA2889370.1 hypothetical protein [Nonomuraea soli]